MSGINAIVDDACDPVALCRAERAALAIAPYEIVRGSSSLARDMETTDRLLLKWRSTTIEFHSLIEEPMPGASRRDIGDVAARIMTAARADATTQEEVDGLMRDLRDVACYLAEGIGGGMTASTMAYAQMRSPFAPGLAMRSSPTSGGPNIRTADDDLLHALLGRTTPTILVRSAAMIGDVATISLQAAGDMAGDVVPDAIWRLRLHSRFSASDPRP